MTTPPDPRDTPALIGPVPHPRWPAEAPAGSFLLRDVELSEPVPALAGGGASRALLLVRLFTEPLGLVEVPLPAGPADVAGRVWQAIGSEVNRRVVAAGGDPRTTRDLGGIRLSGTADWVAEREKVLARAPAVSVVLCTRERADRLAPGLDRLRAQAYPAFEIVVVDNAPTTDAVRRLVDALDDPRVRYVLEPRPGLSRARNAGVAAARHDVIAFIDDDESADAYWLAELARGFAAAGRVGCVSGMILPAELETQPQLWFEEYGGHSKGRGFRQAVIDPTDRNGQSPLYPLPPFGAGGNMAFTRAALARIGGFDEAMGAGTPVRGSEDTAAFTDVLLAGFRLVYQPSAFVRHTHYRTLDGLRTQMYGYGSGVTAYYTRLLLDSPQRLPALIRLLPTALRDIAGKNSARTGHLPAGFPRELLHEQRRGMLHGPGAYLQSRLACRRATARPAEPAEPALRIGRRAEMCGPRVSRPLPVRSAARVSGPPRDGRVPVLMYHSFSSAATPAFRRFAVPPERFLAHLDHLAAAGYTTYTYTQLVAAFAAGTTLPGRPVVITIDDGFRDFATVALPALTERGMTATLFVTTGCTGSTARFLTRDGEGNRPMLGWTELAAAAAAGIEIGAHTVSHPELDRIRSARLGAEVATPKLVLEQRLGVAVRSLAYPYGYYSRRVRAAAEAAGYTSACTVLDLACEPGDDLFALTRLTVADTVDAAGLERILTSCPRRRDVALAHAKRTLWRQVRRAGAGRPVMAMARALRDTRSNPEGSHGVDPAGGAT